MSGSGASLPYGSGHIESPPSRMRLKKARGVEEIGHEAVIACNDSSLMSFSSRFSVRHKDSIISAAAGDDVCIHLTTELRNFGRQTEILRQYDVNQSFKPCSELPAIV